MSDWPALVDGVRLVDFIPYLPNREVKVLGNFFFSFLRKLTLINSSYLQAFFQASEKYFWASTSWLELAWRVGWKTEILCALPKHSVRLLSWSNSGSIVEGNKTVLLKVLLKLILWIYVPQSKKDMRSTNWLWVLSPMHNWAIISFRKISWSVSPAR